MTTGQVAPTDPTRTEHAGSQLAERVANQAIAAVVCWDTTDDAVLAHVVARQLGCQVHYVFASEGRILLESELEPGTRVAVVGEQFDRDLSLDQIVGVVRNNGGTVAAIAATRLPEPTRTGNDQLVMVSTSVA